MTRAMRYILLCPRQLLHPLPLSVLASLTLLLSLGNDQWPASHTCVRVQLLFSSLISVARVEVRVQVEESGDRTTVVTYGIGRVQKL